MDFQRTPFLNKFNIQDLTCSLSETRLIAIIKAFIILLLLPFVEANKKAFQVNECCS